MDANSSPVIDPPARRAARRPLVAPCHPLGLPSNWAKVHCYQSFHHYGVSKKQSSASLFVCSGKGGLPCEGGSSNVGSEHTRSKGTSSSSLEHLSGRGLEIPAGESNA